MDVHHATNKETSKKLFPNYKEGQGVSIALPPNEHFLLTRYRSGKSSGIQDFITSEISDIYNYTNVPKDVLVQIRSLIDQKYND